MEVVNCRGASKKEYKIDVDVIGLPFEEKPGVYIFSRRGAKRGWDALYVGETSNLNTRLNIHLKLHPRLECLRRAGATHIGTLLVPDESERIRIEADLRKSLNPLCNR